MNKDYVENYYKELGAEIRIARKKAGYSQLKLSKLLGYESATYMFLIESGQRKVPFHILESIINWTNASIFDFLTERK